jgi:hypothetical protein
VFDGPPAPQGPRLVEIQDDHGRSITMPPERPRLGEIEDDQGRSRTIGKWVELRNGRWGLQISCRPETDDA